MSARIAAILLNLFSLAAFADIRPGIYDVIDRYGIAPTPDETDASTKKYTEFLSRTQKGGVLRVHTLDPIDLIYPSLFVKGNQSQVAPFYPNVFEFLMRDDIRGNWRTVRSGLARSVTVLPDQKTILINLRDDVLFSDGTRMTADNIVSSWHFYEEEIAGVARSSMHKSKLGDLKIAASDKYQVRVQFGVPPSRLREAIFTFLSIFPIVKENHAASDRIAIPNHYIGTGPYEYVEADRRAVKVKRRLDYWDKKTALYNFDEIEVRSIRDIAVVREAFMRNDLDYYIEGKMQNESMLDEKLGSSFYVKNIREQSPDNVMAGTLFMNMEQGPTADLRVRKALSLLYDADAIFHTLYGGSFSRLPNLLSLSDFSPKGAPSPAVQALIADDPQAAILNEPYETMGISVLTQPSSFREKVKQALSLLREAGYQVINGKQIKDGKPLELMVSSRSNLAEEKAFSYFVSTLMKVGIDAHFHPAPDSATFVTTIDSNQYNLAFIHLEFPRKFDVLDFDEIHFRFGSDDRVSVPGFKSNVANMASPTLDKLIAKMEAADPASEEFRDLSEASLRVISAAVPFILIGERVSMPIYAAKNLCIPPVVTDRILEAAYFSFNGSCPQN
jgi:ABC-type transport system substrate-binding protein